MHLQTIFSKSFCCRSPVNLEAGFLAAFENWVATCRMNTHINVRLHQPCDMEGCILKVPLFGRSAAPSLDVSSHGRPYNGMLFHGTSFSYLPSICSAGCLLRCSIATRGKHAIWTGEAFSRALMYAPPVVLGGKQVQCILGVHAFRTKGSHFKSHDKQLMIRECWHQLQWLFVFAYNGQQLYKIHVAPLSDILPAFEWMPNYSNWEPLPPPWVVTNSNSNPVVAESGVPAIPLPR